MAATPKHKRSKQKQKLSRSASQFNKRLSKVKRVRSKGGKLYSLSKLGKPFLPHRVSRNSPSYKGVVIV